MTESPNTEGIDQPAQPSGFTWLGITIQDLDACDFEEPIAALSFARGYEFCGAYNTAANEHKASPEKHRVFTMMSCVMGMHLKADSPHNPYGPMHVFNGSRSAIPDDFRGPPLETLATAAERANNPMVKARLCDVAWLLDRTKSHLGRAAIAAYLDVISGLEIEAVNKSENRVLARADARDALSRALHLAQVMGGKSDEAKAAQRYLQQLRQRAIDVGDRRTLHDMSELDVRFGISDPNDVATALEKVLDDATGNAPDIEVMWRLAARAYRQSSNNDACNRCKIKASEWLAARAEQAMTQQNSGMIASHWMSIAIAELHGVPDTRERRQKMRHRLIDMQSTIIDEMGHFTHSMDLREIGEAVEKIFSERNVGDLLFLFAYIARSPDPQVLIEQAKTSIDEHPLSSMFGSSHHDKEGKVIHRSDGAGFGDSGEGTAVERQIGQAESIRRTMIVNGSIQTARLILAARAYLSERVFFSLMHHSPFVPPDQAHTYSLGFARFFEGDFTSALFILTPMLESSLRHVLKICGHDVTKFNDATQTQQDLTISALFEQMRQELDSVFGVAITSDIERVFLSKAGPHLRHSVAHGLVHDGTAHSDDAVYACWLMYHLCCLPLLPYRKDIEVEI